MLVNWTVKRFDFYVEQIDFRFKILINIALF